MRKTKLALLFCAVLAVAADLEPARYLEDVKFLASEKMKGRGTGTPELDAAADYIARQFRQAGLKPADGSGYFQTFPVTTNARLGKRNHLDFIDAARRESLKAQQDFIPFNSSASGQVSADVVFAGYGITAREYNYDDYAGLDVRGKLVVILRHEPQELDAKSVFAGRILTEHAQLASKASNAKAHGAAGILLVNDAPNHPGEEDALEKFARSAGPATVGVPFVQVKVAVVDRWFTAAGKSLKDTEAAIDRDLKPRSFTLPDSLHVTLVVDVSRDLKSVRNVAGYLAGGSDEYVVLGAHYDHVGLGEQFSLAPSMAGKPHPGADDNASGTAGVLELARYLASRPKLKRGVLFLTFAGEELGLLGSSFYVNNPELPIAKAVAMLNLDMIGRIRDDRVIVGGAETGSTFKTLLEETAAKSGLKLDLGDQNNYGSSDHTSFITKQVPVLFFFSGLHADYHKPSDTWDKIDAPEAVKLLRLVAALIERLANTGQRPHFMRPEPVRPPEKPPVATATIANLFVAACRLGR